MVKAGYSQLMVCLDETAWCPSKYDDGREAIEGPRTLLLLLIRTAEKETHKAMYNKSQTYSVEDTNADLRQYLACLAKRSRCFI